MSAAPLFFVWHKYPNLIRHAYPRGMEIPLPSSLLDVLTDGLLGQTCTDQSFARELGKVTGVEFNLSADNTQAQVRINRSAGTPFDTTGEVIAQIRGGEFEWVSTRGEDLNIPELQGIQPLSDELISAARTLFNNSPAFIAPRSDGTKTLIAINHQPRPGEIRRCLIEGLSKLRPEMDLARALRSFAAFRGLGIRFEENRIAFSDGTSILLHHRRPLEIAGGLSLRDVRADAAFMAAEHQLLFDAISSAPQITFDAQSNTAIIDNEHTVQAIPLAIIDGSRWVWSWSLNEVNGRATEGLARFGFDNGLFLLTKAEINTTDAEAFDLINVAKQVLQIWTHAVIKQEDGSSVVLLLQHPRLTLPPATKAAIEATLYHPLPRELDGRRAVASYAAHRNIPFDGFALTVEEQHVTVDFEGEHLTRVH